MYNLSEKLIQYYKKNKNKDVIKPVSIVEENEEMEKEDAINDARESFKTELVKLNAELKGAGGDVKFEKMEYTPLSDEEILKKAQSGVEEKYALKKSAIDKSYDESVSDLHKKSEELKQDGKLQKLELDEMYNQLEEKLGNNAIKRGIARSSIVSEQIKNLGVEKIKDILSIDDKTATLLKDNSTKLENLQSEYQKAVSNLNLEKVLEINENIENLKKEQEAKIEEVLKYNNTLTRQEAEIKNDIDPPTEVKISQIKSQIVKQAIDFYSKLPKEERMDAFLNDKEILELLGDQSNVIGNYIKAMP